MKQNINNPKWNKECLKLMESHLEDELIKNLKHSMTTYKLKNLQDDGSALDRAKKLLSVSDWANSPKEISRATGVKYQALLNYRQDLDKLDKASWNTINELSQLYDIYQIQKSLPYQDMLEVQNQVHKMMNELRDNHDGTTENILIDQMERIITSDPNAIYKIYRRLHKE